MDKLDRAAPLPKEMQGHWVDADDPASKLIIEGSEITCFGQVVNYDYKLLGNDDGAIAVSLKINDEADIDDFERANITELVVTPEGDFHAYNVKFASQFIRDGG